MHDEYQYLETSFVPLFKNEGFKTAWISNQDMGHSFAHFLAECDTSVFANAGKSVYVFSSWIDEELLSIFDSVRYRNSSRNLYIFHTIGSHWYYNNHVPESRFYYTPVTADRVVTNNSIEQIVNSYDNTIRYMDVFLDELIKQFENKPAIIIYQSDLGEALGENGEYLHANATEQAKHPACIIWYSDKYAEIYPDKIKALIRNKNKRFRTDYVFYSILFAVDIEADEDSPTMNIFR